MRWFETRKIVGRGLVSGCVLALVVGSIAGATPTRMAGRASRCPAYRHPGSKLAASSKLVVITGSVYGDVLGCYKPTGRILYLGDYDTTLAVEAAGPYAVVSAQTEDVNPDISPQFAGCTVSVYDLRTGRRVRFTDGDPTHVFVSPTGAAAYFYGDVHSGWLYVLDHHGHRLIDQGSGIAVSSIHLVPGKLDWRHAGAPRSAPTSA
jgi:hypothetical protein